MFCVSCQFFRCAHPLSPTTPTPTPFLRCLQGFTGIRCEIKEPVRVSNQERMCSHWTSPSACCIAGVLCFRLSSYHFPNHSLHNSVTVHLSPPLDVDRCGNVCGTCLFKSLIVALANFKWALKLATAISIGGHLDQLLMQCDSHGVDTAFWFVESSFSFVIWFIWGFFFFFFDDLIAWKWISTNQAVTLGLWFGQ